MKNPSELRVTLETGAATTALVYRSSEASIGAVLVLGHGAGAGQQSTFMVGFARALSTLGIDIVTFNFLYIEQRRRIPDRGPALEACYRGVIDTVRGDRGLQRDALFIGGKSMGGRIATQVAAAAPGIPLSGLVLLGYPLHPPGKPAERRDRHLPAVRRPMLFIQGSRDAFGTPDQLRPVLESLDPKSTLRVVENGDHSFKLPRTDAAGQAAVYANIQQDIVRWMRPIVAAAVP